MHDPKVDPFDVPKRAPTGNRRDHGFGAGRHETVKRLVRAGISPELAVAWVNIWDESTASLPDFRAAPDFWSQCFQYALEEYRRGYRPRLD